VSGYETVTIRDRPSTLDTPFCASEVRDTRAADDVHASVAAIPPVVPTDLRMISRRDVSGPLEMVAQLALSDAELGALGVPMSERDWWDGRESPRTLSSRAARA